VRIYLSGNMTPDADYYDSWTADLALDLDDTDFVCSSSMLKDPSDGKYIVNHDLARLTRCDMVVANLSVTDKNFHLTGLIVEVYEAYKQNKPVYTFFDDVGDYIPSDQGLSPWIQQFVTRHFNSYSDLIDFIRFEDNV